MTGDAIPIMLCRCNYFFSLVVAQQNYNEIKWRQRSLSVENGAEASVQRGAFCKNSPTAYSSQKLHVKYALTTTLHVDLETI